MYTGQHQYLSTGINSLRVGNRISMFNSSPTAFGGFGRAGRGPATAVRHLSAATQASLLASRSATSVVKAITAFL